MRRTFLPVPAFFLMLLFFFGPSKVFCNQSEPLEEAWYILTFDGSYFGSMHTLKVKGTWNGREVIKTIEAMEMTITRMGIDMNAQSRTTFVEDFDCEPLGFYSEMMISSMKTITEGTIKDNIIEIEQQLGGNKQTKTISFDEDTVFPSSKFKKELAAKLTPGTNFTLKIFIPDLLMIVDNTISVVGAETIMIEGKLLKTLKTESTNALTPHIKSTEWLDTNGSILQFETPMLGSIIRGVKTTKEEALNVSQSKRTVDIFKALLVKPDKPITNPQELQSITYQLFFRDKNVPADFLSDERQKIIEETDDSLTIEVKRLLYPIQSKRMIPISDNTLSQYLEPTEFIQSNDPDIINEARRIRGEERNIATLAEKVNSLVFKSVSQKNLSIGFASASEVIKTKEGDCSEHSVLAVALLRAMGIPSRLCVGLVYSEQLQAFGYHMWCEFYAESWYQIDPTFNQLQPDPTHICFSKGNFDGKTLLQSAAYMNSFGSNLSLSIKKIQE